MVRRYHYRGDHTEGILTDAQGRLLFPANCRWNFTALLSMEFVVAQSVLVIYQGEECPIWSNTRRSRDNNAELGGRPLELSCELTGPVRIHQEFGSILSARRVW